MDSEFNGIMTEEGSADGIYENAQEAELVRLIKLGKRRAIIAAASYLLMTIPNNLSQIGEFLSSGALAMAGGRLIGTGIAVLLAVCLIRGGNKSRVFIGVVSCIGLIISLLMLLPSIFEAGMPGGIVMAVLTALLAASYGVCIRYTLFDNAVKIYCRDYKKWGRR